MSELDDDRATIPISTVLHEQLAPLGIDLGDVPATSVKIRRERKPSRVRFREDRRRSAEQRLCRVEVAAVDRTAPGRREIVGHPRRQAR